MKDIVELRGGVPARFDARETNDKVAKADALIEYAKRVHDWALLEAGVEAKIKEQSDFVDWWGQVVTPSKASFAEVADPRPLLSAADATNLTNITKQQVSEWKSKLADEERYLASLYGATYRKAMGRGPAGMDPHYSSESNEWETPQDLFDELDAEFSFELDVCALKKTAKCKRFFSPDEDGLAQEWSGVCWMNPPYGSVIGQWVEKARLSAKDGAIVVCLVPARVDTEWWWDNCRYGEIRFLKGRLKFGGADNSAPFPSAVVVFGRKPKVVWWER